MKNQCSCNILLENINVDPTDKDLKGQRLERLLNS